MSTARTVPLPLRLLEDTIDTLEMVGCQFDLCRGETLTPIDMVTCHRCSTLAQLRVQHRQALGTIPDDALPDADERALQRGLGK